jgi:hypothetical protein
MTVEPVADRRAVQARINGAKSKGPRSPEGKARSAQNARRHGLCAEGPVDEAERAELRALEAELLAEARPQGATEHHALRQVAAALWRISRADAIEAEMLTEGLATEEGTLTGADLFRAPEGQRALSLLLRYRGAAERQLQRARRMLAQLAEARAMRAWTAPARDAKRTEARPAERAEARPAPPAPPEPPRPFPSLNRRERRRRAAVERRPAG